MRAILNLVSRPLWVVAYGNLNCNLKTLPATVEIACDPRVKAIVAAMTATGGAAALAAAYAASSLPTPLFLAIVALLLTVMAPLYAMLGFAFERRRLRFDRWQVIVSETRFGHEELWRTRYDHFDGLMLRTWSHAGYARDILELHHANERRTIPLRIAGHGRIAIGEASALAQRLGVRLVVQPDNLPAGALTPANA